ncbi:unnamed protein product [Lupinus luteus]|uniref:non-specific serine/threonine protein kinase n=1 Tax=Lupinus luteus TaxID=3873 RepID=A0AAV1WR52_LUPLU
MANTNSSNESPPSPPSDDSEPPQSSPPSKSHPPPSPSNSSPPPSPSQSPPPSPPKSLPPSSPPPPKLSPPPTSHDPPPNDSPPPKNSPPPTTTPPPPSSPPPTPPSTTPPPASTPSTPPPPPSNDGSPPPSPSQQSPPPPPQTQIPPPPPKNTPSPTLPAPGSNVTPARPPPHGSVPNPPPVSPYGHHPKPSNTPSNSSSRPTSNGSGENNTGEIVGLTLGVVAVLFILGLLLFLIFRRNKNRPNLYAIPPPNKFHHRNGGADVCYYVEEQAVRNGPQDGFYSKQVTSPGTNPSDPASVPMGQMLFSYDMISEITDGFSSQNVIGEGGFGCVYKAFMPDGRIGAVKLLNIGGGQGEREFRAEVDIISRIHHRHLVSLIGYCISEQQRVLIYEFVPNGNLSHHMHGSGVPVLSWEKRIKIAFGSARGLAYLHEGCNPKIIHRDIKSANILLDDAFEAQVADFGLARLTDDVNTHVSTRVMGTFGYMAPEYATSGKLTDRSDVFSFGVVLLELITGRKPVDPLQPVGEESLVEWARPILLHAIETGDYSELVDPRLEGQYVDSEMFRMIEAAVACVRHSAPKRPSMVQVARALETGDQSDLSNGMKYGQSTVYDSGQYNKDVMRFRRMANGSFGESDLDMYSKDYSSKEMPEPQYQWMRSISSTDSEAKAYYSLNNSASENRS